jgi:hypothetical protein
VYVYVSVCSDIKSVYSVYVKNAYCEKIVS